VLGPVPAWTELAELVARNPLRQGLRAVQLKALHQAGRQADALASYAGLRDRLREELGPDPGAGLVALQQTILTSEPSASAQRKTNLPAAMTELIRQGCRGRRAGGATRDGGTGDADRSR
jgi:DNA-binding SARP family transcriptional activator